MKSYVVVPGHDVQLRTVRHLEHPVEPLHVILELRAAAVQALVHQIAQYEHDVGPVQRHGGLKRAKHLPLPAQLVEPVAVSRTEEVRVGQHNGSDGRFSESWFSRRGVLILRVQLGPVALGRRRTCKHKNVNIFL